MKVLKAINNNVVSCVDDAGNELVVMGRGLGFHARPGDILTPDMVEKVFRMDTPSATSRLKDLFSQLPTDLLELCTRIIDYANTVLGHRLNESIYLTLTDHIQFAISRVKQGNILPNPLITEVRVFYPTEFAVGRYALDMIRSGLDITLSEDEAASIALHIVNAEYDSSMNATMHATQTLQPILEILEGWPDLWLNRNHLFYDELIVHVKFMAMQAFSSTEGNWSGPKLVQTVQDFFPNEYACAGAIASYLTQKCGNQIPVAEQAYLAICIYRACIT